MGDTVASLTGGHTMQPYTGVNTSLYSTLDAQSITQLEQAIALTDYGQYSDAQQIYGKALLSQRLKPVVVLGRAELALKQYKIGELFRICDESLDDASRQNMDLEAAAFRLIALMRAFAAYSHKGVCEPAVAESSRAQGWLEDTPVTEYSDLQVCILTLEWSIQTLIFPLGQLHTEVRPDRAFSRSWIQLHSRRRWIYSKAQAGTCHVAGFIRSARVSPAKRNA